MKQEFKLLTEEQKEKLLKYFRVHKFEKSFDLVYENQIPNVSVVVSKGSIQLIGRNKVKADINLNTWLGFYHNLMNKPVRYGWRVIEGSELLIIEKSELLKLVNEKDQLIKEVLETKFAQFLQRS